MAPPRLRFLLLATPAYFFPKAADILFQQSLIAALVLAFSARTQSFPRVRLWYLVCFGGAHLALFVIPGILPLYALVMTLAALASAFVFPYLILYVRGGFIYSYMTHLLFYILLALLIHVWPSPIRLFA